MQIPIFPHFIIVILVGVKWYLTLVFIFNSRMTESLFYIYIGYLHVFFEEMFAQFLCAIFKLVIGPFIIEL